MWGNKRDVQKSNNKTECNFVCEIAFTDKSKHSSQTKDLSEAVCELPKSVSSYDISFMISNLWSQIDEDDQVKMIFFFYNNLKYDGQCDVFSLLGNLLNQDDYEQSLEYRAKTEETNLLDLKSSTKIECYENCDPRLSLPKYDIS